MYCVLNGHENIYDIQTITQIFFPNEKFVRVHAVDMLGITAVSTLTPHDCSGALYSDGCLMQQFVLPLSEQDESDGTVTRTPVANDDAGSQEVRRRLMVSLFLACRAYSKQDPPWGALTGIRPSKMARMLTEKGYSRDFIIDAMERNYLTHRDKTAFAIDVAVAEKKIIERQPKNAFSLYVGIPFCPTRCLYCSFASYPINKGATEADIYLDALSLELQAIRNITLGQAVSAVYVGGGTPTALSGEQLERLLTLIKQLFGDINELTVEAGRPDTINPEKLRVLKNYSVNRISINPQSLCDETLQRIGRGHRVDDFYDSFALARSVGFDYINADVILGLPGETTDHITHTMDGLLKLKPENVTVHMLTIKRASILREVLDRYPQPNIAELEKMLDISQHTCREAGMKPYYMYRQKNMLGNFENVGYCLPGRESTYNVLMMEETQTVWAAGAGAISKLVFGDKIERVFNVKNLNDYLNRIDEMIGRKEVWADAYTDPTRN